MPWFMLLALGAMLALFLLRRGFAALGVYRWVWHPALFDLALYVLLLYAISRLSAFFQ